MKYKFKYIIKSTLNFFKTFILFPHIWVLFILIILSIITIIISKNYYLNGQIFISSIYSNIFTGLITGFLIMLLSGLKNTYTSYLKSKIIFLNKIHKMILHFFSKQSNLISTKYDTDEDFFNDSYNTGAAANNVNSYLLQSTFDKTKWFDARNYFLKNYDYDAIKIDEKMEELRYFIYNNAENKSNKKIVINYIHDTAYKTMSNLNHKILNDITNIKIKLSILSKSIL